MDTSNKEVSKVKEFLLGVGMREVDRGISDDRETYVKYIGEYITVDVWAVFVHIPKDFKSSEFFISVYRNDNNDRYQVHSLIELYTKVQRVLEECEGRFRLKNLK